MPAGAGAAQFARRNSPASHWKVATTTRAHRWGLALADVPRRIACATLIPSSQLLPGGDGRGFRAAISADIHPARPNYHPIRLAPIDLDNFEAVNDRWVHQAGDDVLRGSAYGSVGVRRDRVDCPTDCNQRRDGGAV